MFPEVRSSPGKEHSGDTPVIGKIKGSVILNSVIFFSLTHSLAATDALGDGEI